MGRVSTGISWLLLTVGVVTAQTVQLEDKRLLPQWLTGIIAVSAFLFLVFIAALVNKVWCEQSSGGAAGDSEKDEHCAMTNGATCDTYDTSMNMVRSSECENAYENFTIDNSDDKVTSM